jgi:hypothetical protein
MSDKLKDHLCLLLFAIIMLVSFLEYLDECGVFN